MNQEYLKVKKFHKMVGHPISDKPILMGKERARSRVNWKIEELKEFLEAVDNENLPDQADAIIDLMYFCLGTLVEMGIKPRDIFDIVHKANMNKKFPDGKIRRNDQGKILKPQSWEDPYPKILREISRQKNG